MTYILYFYSLQRWSIPKKMIEYEIDIIKYIQTIKNKSLFNVQKVVRISNIFCDIINHIMAKIELI